LFITGGAGGIGAATARRFAEEGAAVVIADVRPAQSRALVDELVESGARAIAVECDVTRRDSVEAAFACAADTYGSVDYMVACAGLLRDNLVHKMTDEDWNLVIQTH